MKNYLILFLLCFAFAANAQLLTPTDNATFHAESNDTIGNVSFVDLKTWIAAAAGSGTVTSVGLALPSEFSISGSPVTSSGTLTGGWATQTTNKVFAAPNGSTGVPTFRAMVDADIPTLPASKITGNNVTAGSSKITLGGSPTGAGLNAFSIDIVEANLGLANIGGSLNLATQTTGTLAVANGGTGAISLDDVVAGSSKISVTAGTDAVIGGDVTLDVNEANLTLSNIGGSTTLAQLPDGTANQFLGTNAAGTAVEQKTFATGTSGTNFAIAHSTNTITFNLPDASATNRGVTTTTAQTFAGEKTFSNGIVGGTSGTQAAEFEGVVKNQVTNLTANTTLSKVHSVITADCSSGAFTITMPAGSATTAGWTYTIVKTDDSANVLTIDLNGTDTFFDTAQSKILMGEGSKVNIEIGSTSSNTIYR